MTTGIEDRVGRDGVGFHHDIGSTTVCVGLAVAAPCDVTSISTRLVGSSELVLELLG